MENSKVLGSGNYLPGSLMRYTAQIAMALRFLIDGWLYFHKEFEFSFPTLQGEDLCDAAIREVKEETGVSTKFAYNVLSLIWKLDIHLRL